MAGRLLLCKRSQHLPETLQLYNDVISKNVNELYQRLMSGYRLDVNLPESSTIDLQVLKDVYIRLVNQYPGDCGCFSLFFLNLVRLEPGQSVFLEANLPHAYISGDCVECMACSDNVVRAGLTPKFKDVDCLLSMLQYEPRTQNKVIFSPKRRLIYAPHSEVTGGQSELPTILTYAPPVEEFAVDRIWVSGGRLNLT
ncbi:unnamed protein product [Echinostoma caproni]|uniref:PMI_typeI_hel domain-containing protein n=1 Tax=Echinostoma caproni TaxID=27848 RepID=A0A183AQV2_9TREM|nr:unnamed protein product [Echinostoma caproni]